MKSNKFIILICLIFVVLKYVENSKMRLKNTRFSFKTCTNENNCEECTEEGYFKTCKNVCYCCNIEGKCLSQNE